MMQRSLAILLLLTLAGCHPPRKSITSAALLPTLSAPVVWPGLNARVVPPIGWRADPIKSSGSHQHQVWVSPSGSTAYGVIRFNLPLPVGADLVLWGFLREMRKSEGSAELISKAPDPDLPGLRFIAKGGRYTVRTNLTTRGFTGWAVYAGTLTNQSINQEELAIAEAARERTVVNSP